MPHRSWGAYPAPSYRETNSTPDYPQPSERSIELRERMTRVEMSLIHLTEKAAGEVRVNESNKQSLNILSDTVNRLGNRVIQTENTTTALDKTVQEMKSDLSKSTLPTRVESLEDMVEKVKWTTMLAAKVGAGLYVVGMTVAGHIKWKAVWEWLVSVVGFH